MVRSRRCYGNNHIKAHLVQDAEQTLGPDGIGEAEEKNLTQKLGIVWFEDLANKENDQGVGEEQQGQQNRCAAVARRAQPMPTADQ
ncbi:hypothetical protein E1301_Tti008578 [Triplophysa tibetana]|uniref:Uncharacterized protein n=1 Tax=Triplophysa tibetana TaxID=1572043 RepID=A0A5A9P3R7_9TELE|nr:hypothetical protein E1301_Tti008578 [Triplophysa tibetana]